MLSETEINEILYQFKYDLKIEIYIPELLILPKYNQIGMAQIGDITPNLVELFLGNIFFEHGVYKKYLYQILYHEFTHIVDRLSYFTEIQNQREQRNLLFPYTEFHAAQSEMMKRLELYYNPSKEIRISTKLYYDQDILSLQDFLKCEQHELDLHIMEFKNNPSIISLQKCIYLMIYNIGYYSICSQYNIPDNLFVDYNHYSIIKDEMNAIKQKLLECSIPSEHFLRETNNIINNVVDKLI